MVETHCKLLPLWSLGRGSCLDVILVTLVKIVKDGSTSLQWLGLANWGLILTALAALTGLGFCGGCNVNMFIGHMS